jgi:hypothetical protein
MVPSERVLVINDGSTDHTSERANLELEFNEFKKQIVSESGRNP